MKTAEIRALGKECLEAVYSISDGEKINECLQCGTCTASCPTSTAMDCSPREIIGALRAGMLDRVLNSNTVWLCTSCYLCDVRCPAGIPITDIMCELKRFGVKHGVYPTKSTTTAVLAQAFVESVDRYGRNHEPEMIAKYYLRTGPLKSLGQIAVRLRLLKRGRMRFLPHRIKGMASLRKMMVAIEQNGTESHSQATDPACMTGAVRKWQDMGFEAED